MWLIKWGVGVLVSYQGGPAPKPPTPPSGGSPQQQRIANTDNDVYAIAS